MPGISRRKFLRYLAAAAAGAAVSSAFGYEFFLTPSTGKRPGGISPTTAGYQPPPGATPEYARFLNWLNGVARPYAGKSLNVSMEYEFSPLALQKLDLDFYRAAHVSDQYSLKPYYLHLEDISLMTRTKAPTYDIYTVDYQDVASFKDHIISPTELAATYPDLTYEKLTPADFLDIPWSYCAAYPPTPFSSVGQAGDILFIPLDMSTMLQFYRIDLYQKAGLSPATTWEGYITDAMAFVNGSGVLGTTNAAAPDISIVFEFLNVLKGYGANLWEVSGGSIVSGLGSDAMATALEKYVALAPFSDPASQTYSWPDVATDLLHGYGASAMEFQGYDTFMNDVTRSTVVNEIGYVPMPAGTAGSFSTYGGSGVGVSKYSKNPGLAWLWLQWATGLGTQETAFLGPLHPFPSRKAVFNEPLVQSALTTPAYGAQRITKQVWDKGNIATLLPFPKWAQLVGPISSSLNKAWTGASTPKAALNDALLQVQNLGQLTF
ncbi:MAG TPA: extracellular solute-binding protein [Nitrososphaerales archaeon]|nr:extracellular solute-binding protein [Nitrososphaerales archaeon]